MSSGSRGRRPKSTTTRQTPPAKRAKGANLTQDDIPVIVQAVIDALPTTARPDNPSNETHTTRSTGADSDETQTRQPATRRRSTRSATAKDRDGTAAQTHTASANANNNDGHGLRSTTEAGVQPSADTGRRSVGTTDGDAASNTNTNDARGTAEQDISEQY